MLVDLNCDLGEGAGTDEELLPLITTANVACGFHAGDPATAFATVSQATKHHVRVGAHPSFPDRANFGRTEMERTEQQIIEDCVFQIGSLDAVARARGTALSHIKPHGALYNMAGKNFRYAHAIAECGRLFRLPIFGMPGSAMEAACRNVCDFIPEGFADRRYTAEGFLVPRSQPDAMLTDAREAARQAVQLARQGIRTLCVHGDNPHAVEFVRELRKALVAEGFEIRAFS